jgi:type I restriction enzyme R subunit
LKVGSLSAPFSRFLRWKSPIKKENETINQTQILANRMLEKETLLKLIRYNTVFEKEEVKDEKT